jgi:hypothetical protein
MEAQFGKRSLLTACRRYASSVVCVISGTYPSACEINSQLHQAPLCSWRQLRDHRIQRHEHVWISCGSSLGRWSKPGKEPQQLSTVVLLRLSQPAPL